MAYIGKSPTGTGVRQRYYFTATGGETSLSGTDDNGLTLSYSDGAYVDVLLNGIELVAGTDYNTSTANTIAGLAALAASDVVTVTVYDIFTVADTVSAKDGGTFSGNVVFNGNTTGLDLNGTDLILDADADSKIEASTDDTINIISGGTTGLTVNSSGYVLKPQLPAFHVYRSVASAEGVTGTIDFNTVTFNNGTHYNTTNDYFVAPVDGVYTFSFSGLGASNASGDALTAGVAAHSEIQYSSDSGSTYTGFAFGYSSSGQYPNLACSGVIELNSGDYVRVQMITNYVYVSNNAQYDPKFSGALIG